MSQADLQKLNDLLEATVISVAHTESEEYRAKVLDRYDTYIDLTVNNLATNNPNTFGNSKLPKDFRMTLMNRFRDLYRLEIRKSTNLIRRADVSSLTVNGYRMLRKMAVESGRNRAVGIEIYDGRAFHGVLFISPIELAKKTYDHIQKGLSGAAKALNIELEEQADVLFGDQANPNKLHTRTRTLGVSFSGLVNNRQGGKSIKSKVQVGHIADSEDYSAYTTPLSHKLTLLKEALDTTNSAGTTIRAEEPEIAKKIETIVAAAHKVLDRKHNYTVETKVNKAINMLAVDGTFKVLVTVAQEEGINTQQLDKKEQRISEGVKRALDKVVSGQDFLTQKSSRSIMDMLHLSVAALFTKGRGLSFSAKARAERKASRTSNARRGKAQEVDPVAPVKVRKLDETSVHKSTLSLQALINNSLHSVLQENMTSPRLVYRTGRFAKSVKVERVLTSKKGFYTIYYNYMKDPYQTFEPGSAQGTRQRNPKALISKSIREIAYPIIGARFRSVRV